ncbi:peptidase C39 [Anaerosporobacter sp.]|uniref:peptidase C39 n=1 Tax=Anaerosporobacter sp. TaxID=1872529 RepID=UPI00286F12B8|nr:peptidase C39 [Anaerosporobacter sp.]
MKNDLYYQTSEYDCGPTTLCNAMRFLYKREQIPPEILKAIFMYTLDAYNEMGEVGRSGTSRMAMEFLSSWFNQFGKTKGFPIHSEFLKNNQVYIGPNSRITSCLQQKGVVVVRVSLEGDDHYILLTGLQEGMVAIFDPYDMSDYNDLTFLGVTLISNQPKKMNRLVKPEILNSDFERSYSLGEIKEREAMLIYNTDTRYTPERTIEYMI